MIFRWLSNLVQSPRRAEPGTEAEWVHVHPRLSFHANTREEALLHLFHAVGAPDAEMAPAAARAIRQTLETYAPGELPRVDEEVRRLQLPWRYRPFTGHPRWNVTPEAVRSLSVDAACEGAVLGVASFHASGHVREAAVERLAAVRDGSEVPFLLLRMNDWVDPVRLRAGRAVRERTGPACAGAFVRTMALVLRLLRPGLRTDQADAARGVIEMLRAPEARPALEAGLDAPEREVRRTCAALLLAPGTADAGAIARALHSADPGVRVHAARAAAAAVDDAALDEILPALLADPFVGVRSVGLRLAATRRAEDAGPWLTRALLDRSPALRAGARAHLAKRGPVDFAAFYRAALEPDAGNVVVAVSGVGETGGAEDADRVARFLADPRARVRRAAVFAVARLAKEGAAALLAPVLEDAAPSVSDAARRVLEPHAPRLDEDALAALFRPRLPAYVRRNAFALLARRGKWEGLRWIILGVADADETVARAARVKLEAWQVRMNRGHGRPTPQQRERIESALDVCAGRIDPRLAQWLRFAIKD